MAGVAAVFYSVDHAENDYEVATAGSNSERERVEQNYCARRTWLTDIGWGCSFLSTLLLFITLWLDPEHGMTAAARKHQSEDHLPTPPHTHIPHVRENSKLGFQFGAE